MLLPSEACAAQGRLAVGTVVLQAPVVPMAIRGMCASIFSRSGLLNTLRLPSRLRAHVVILADTPVAGVTASAEGLEEKVKAMRGEWA